MLQSLLLCSREAYVPDASLFLRIAKKGGTELAPSPGPLES